jgi:hypothetical protein
MWAADPNDSWDNMTGGDAAITFCQFLKFSGFWFKIMAKKIFRYRSI